MPAHELAKGGHILIYASGQLITRLLFHYFFTDIIVKTGYFCLTFLVKIGYNMSMFRNILSFILRILLIAVLWAFIWRLVEPKTQLMRILRAVLLVLGLLVILAVLRVTG